MSRPIQSLPKFSLELDDISNSTFIKYHLKFEDSSRERGYFFMLLENLSSLSIKNHPVSNDNFRLRSHLLDIGLPDTCQTAFLASFYPNGFRPKREHLREGIGGRIFDFCLYLARINDCRVIYATSIKDPMIELLKSRKFMRFNPCQNLYYRLL